MPVAGQHRPAERTPVRSFIFGDIRQVSGELIAAVSGVPLGELDLVVGSPPCQGFSTAGKRDPNDPRSQLVFEMARLLLELRPQTFAMENVPGITSMLTPEGMPVLDQFCRMLSDGGFASYKALRKMLEAHPDAGAAMRGGRHGQAEHRAAESPQDDLFEAPAARR